MLKNVQLSLQDMLGEEYTASVCAARAFLTGESESCLRAVAEEKIAFWPQAFALRQEELMDRVGQQAVPPFADTQGGAPTRAYAAAQHTPAAPLSGLGAYRLGEDGRLYFAGKGLMGREFASASLRWLHLKGDIPRPRIIAACDTDEGSLNWFRQDPDTRYFYRDHRELLENPEVEAVYCAVPHFLHARVYGDVIRAGKHLLGEKPFGMDQAACLEIEQSTAERPDVFVRCASEFPFYPAMQQMVSWYREGRFGKIIEVRSAIKHSSDMDINKPINWKRTLAANGAYGCMGDLGIHAQHLSFRLGLMPRTVSAVLANLVRERRDAETGEWKPCETWDNALLLCEGENPAGDRFPMTFEMKRMAPGCANTVEYEIYGMKMSARFSTDDPNALRYTLSHGQEQAWARLPIGQRTLYPVITGGIFEFGFSDSLLQMLAAYVSELRGLPCPFGCLTPQEANKSHELLTAALMAYETGKTVTLLATGPGRWNASPPAAENTRSCEASASGRHSIGSGSC